MFTQVKAKEAKGSKGTTKGEGKTRSGKCLSVRQDHMKLPSSGPSGSDPGPIHCRQTWLLHNLALSTRDKSGVAAVVGDECLGVSP